MSYEDFMKHCKVANIVYHFTQRNTQKQKPLKLIFGPFLNLKEIDYVDAE